MLLLKSILLESQVAVVVGRVGMDGDIQSVESKKSHQELGVSRGKCWRYNPYNETLYWHGDDSEHDKEDEIRVEDHLLKKYNYGVRRNITLESSEDEYNMADAFPGHFNKAHGYMSEALSSIPLAYSGYMGGTNRRGERVAQKIENVIETDHSEVSAFRNRWRWAKGAPDTIFWTDSPQESNDEEFEQYSRYITEWLEHKTGTHIGRHRFFPEGYSTWSDRVHHAAGIK
jgi:hypothetical protein